MGLCSLLANPKTSKSCCTSSWPGCDSALPHSAFGLFFVCFFCGVSSRFLFMCCCYPALSIFSLCFCCLACCHDAWFGSPHVTWFENAWSLIRTLLLLCLFRSLTIRRAPSTDVSGNLTNLNWSCVPVVYYYVLILS